MKFLLIIGHDDNFGPNQALIARIMEWNAEMSKRNILQGGNPLRPWQEAKTVRVRDGKAKVTSGSFSDSREKISAYVLVDCQSEDEALSVASAHPMAAEATIEIRPVWENIGEM